ncbi:MAG: glycosyltransferase family 2 protein [bacterium]|nr:glycosyltransferase family 2 protein [bacterium]
MTYVPSVTIAIISFNTRDALRDCLRSIERVRDEVNVDVIIVDNASHDGSLDMLKWEFPHIRVIANSENIGFACAVNQAFEASSSDFFMMLNPDTWVAKNSIVGLVEMAERDTEIAVVGAQLTSFEGDSQQSVLAKPTLAKEFLNLLPELKSILLPYFIKSILIRGRERRRGQIIEVPAVSGGAMLMRSSAFRQAGGMDERFFVYHEEVDLCLRLHKSGWKIVFAPQAQILHYDALSTQYNPLKIPSEPVLSWRLNGLSILFEKHGTRGQRGQFIAMVKLLLRFRAMLCRFRSSIASGSAALWLARAKELEMAAVSLGKLSGVKTTQSPVR